MKRLLKLPRDCIRHRQRMDEAKFKATWEEFDKWYKAFERLSECSNKIYVIDIISDMSTYPTPKYGLSQCMLKALQFALAKKLTPNQDKVVALAELYKVLLQVNSKHEGGIKELFSKYNDHRPGS